MATLQRVRGQPAKADNLIKQEALALVHVPMAKQVATLVVARTAAALAKVAEALGKAAVEVATSAVEAKVAVVDALRADAIDLFDVPANQPDHATAWRSPASKKCSMCLQ